MALISFHESYLFFGLCVDISIKLHAWPFGKSTKFQNTTWGNIKREYQLLWKHL